MPALLAALKQDTFKVADAAAEALGRIGDLHASGAIEAARTAGRIEEVTARTAVWRMRRARAAGGSASGN